MSETVKARSFTFISDRDDGLTLSLCLPDRHMYVKISDCMAALALAQLAEHNAEVSRRLTFERPGASEYVSDRVFDGTRPVSDDRLAKLRSSSQEIQPPCDSV